MAAVSASQPPRVPSPEVIDVDALEDDAIAYSGFDEHPRLLPLPRAFGSSSSSSAHHPPDDEVLFTGFRRGHPRRASRHHGGAQAAGSSAGSTGDNAIVLDSDEEMPSSSSSRHRRHRTIESRPRLMSPPPPVAQRGHTPGVPPLPAHLASQASLPRRHRPSAVPPPIRPVSQPLAFEARIPMLPRLPPRNPPPPPPAPAAAPRSHHQPAMGFGGALLAMNRQNAQEEANRARERPSRGFALPTFTEMFRRMTGYGDEEGDAPARSENNSRRWRNRVFPWYWDDGPVDPEPELLSPFGNDDAWFGLPNRLDALRPPVGRNPYIPKAETIPMWKPEYTHPDKTAPGFTHDFAVPDDPSSQTSGSLSPRTVIVLDDEAGSSSGAASGSSSATAVETTLVCARCLDPLVLAPADGSSEGDVKSRRVWALRCGHMLDGKCVMALMSPHDPSPRPESAVLPEEATSTSSSKGKGKARADPEPLSAAFADHDHDMLAAEVAPAPVDRKGKRKAVEALEPEESPKRAATASAVAAAAESMEMDAGNSIRSRLRSRNRAAADVSPSSASANGPDAHVMPADGHPFAPPRRGRRQSGTAARQIQSQSQHHGHGHGDSGGARAKGKGKGRAKVERKPAVEAEHEWRCPVGGCGCVHFSVRVEGCWTNDEGRGPIALFV